jgi:hypothetical protein
MVAEAGGAPALVQAVHKHGGPPEKKKPCQSDETRVIQEDGIIDRIEAESVHKKKEYSPEPARRLGSFNKVALTPCVEKW